MAPILSAATKMINRNVSFPIACLILSTSFVSSFHSSPFFINQRITTISRALHSPCRSSAKPKGEIQSEDQNPLAKASWYAVEAFGKLFSPKEKNISSQSDEIAAIPEIDLSTKPSSLGEALTRIELDNARSYFLSGEVDVLAYDEDCVFADPFVSFSGRDRFVENLSNLGSFITNYDAKMINYEVQEEGTEVKTKLMVKLELNLPWKPVLAWPWGVTYTIDPETFLITQHVESWDISGWEGVKQIFRKPTVKITKKSVS